MFPSKHELHREANEMKKRILYAEANYEAIVRENGYFVDKTAYIAKLESVKNPVFLRPRRFGKSLLCTMLESYYSILFRHGSGRWPSIPTDIQAQNPNIPYSGLLSRPCQGDDRIALSRADGIQANYSTHFILN
jgi:Predicted AAA-ATPase